MTLTVMSAQPVLAQQAGEEIDLEVFYRELQPHGEWFQHQRWGEVWRPNVDSNWRPYTRGHWAWTEDHGWMWVAEEEWGWATFHYGRWLFDENEDFWIWIPGSQWAPAWVQWRESEDQIGWAPLPPDSYLDDGVMRFNASQYDSSRFSRYWVFVQPRFLFEPGLHRHISPVSRYNNFYRSTRPVTVHHHMYRGNIYHPGPDWRRVERWAGRSVPIVTLRTVNTSRDQGWRRLGSTPQVLPIYRPRVQVVPDRPRAALPNVMPRPDRDWRRGDQPRFDRERERDRGGPPPNRPVVVTPDRRPVQNEPVRRNDPRPDPRVDSRPNSPGPTPWFPPSRPQTQPPSQQPVVVRPQQPPPPQQPTTRPAPPPQQPPVSRPSTPQITFQPPSRPGAPTGRPVPGSEPQGNDK